MIGRSMTANASILRDSVAYSVVFTALMGATLMRSHAPSRILNPVFGASAGDRCWSQR